jgi:hypothetical protein
MEFFGKPQDYLNRVKIADESVVMRGRSLYDAPVGERKAIHFMGFVKRAPRLGKS